MPRVRITETSPARVWLCSDDDDPAGKPTWARDMAFIRHVGTVDWEETAKRCTPWTDPDGKVSGIEIDLVT